MDKPVTISDPPSQPFQAFHELNFNINLENLNSDKSCYSPVKDSSAFSSLTSTIGKSDGSSDKENNINKSRGRGKIRKVAKLVESNTEISSSDFNLASTNGRRYSLNQNEGEVANHSSGKKRKENDLNPNVPIKLAKFDKIVGTDDYQSKYQDEATQTSALGGEGKKLLHKGRQRIVGKIVQPTGNVANDKKVSSLERPWRAHMKSKSSTESKAKEDQAVEAKPVKGKDKPWRVNMKPSGSNIEASVEVIPEKKTEAERPWRLNMRPASKIVSNKDEIIPKKPSYDIEEVRKFMLDKKKREKEEKKSMEKENMLKQEIIRQRLLELEKLQKQIVDADIQTTKKTLKVIVYFTITPFYALFSQRK